MIIKDKEVRIRKPQKCFACLRRFDPGTILSTQTIANDGRIYTIYLCKDCDILLSEFEEHFFDSEEGFPEGCVYETYHSYKVDSPIGLLLSLREEKEKQVIKY